MILVVSGHRRSGTSCMMSALLNGLGPGSGWGMLTQPDQERLNQPRDGYIPNPGPLNEVGRMYYKSAKFLRLMPDQSLVKILWDGLPNLPSGNYVVVFMDRDEREINESIARSDAHLRASGVKENPQTLYTFDVFRPYERENVDHVLGIMEQRMDVELLRVNFRDMVNDPIKTFKKIRHTPLGKIRVPIDIERAAEVIRPDYYRVRIENEQERATEKHGVGGSRNQCGRA